jgi:hypothetical protein
VSVGTAFTVSILMHFARQFFAHIWHPVHFFISTSSLFRSAFGKSGVYASGYFLVTRGVKMYLVVIFIP